MLLRKSDRRITMIFPNLFYFIPTLENVSIAFVEIS